MTQSPSPNAEIIPEVLASCTAVMRTAKHVAIDAAAVNCFAGRLVTDGIDVAEDSLLFRGAQDACANFILVTDALNFCFWSDTPWTITYRGKTWTRTFAMVAGVLRAIEREAAWLSADRWATATGADVARIFEGVGEIPLAGRRQEILNETGAVLRERYAGQFSYLVDDVGRDARALSARLAVEFPSFCDIARHPAGTVAFLKRAQICAADLHRTWTAQGHPGLRNLDALTVFADYRLPQLFRHECLLRLDAGLTGKIDRSEIIAAGSREEVELRAATVVIGDQLREAMCRAGAAVASWELDFELWRRARLPEVVIPHHRTLTHFY